MGGGGVGAGGESRDTDKKWFESKVVEVGVDGDTNQIKVRRAQGGSTPRLRHGLLFSARFCSLTEELTGLPPPCGVAARCLSACVCVCDCAIMFYKNLQKTK